MDPDGTRVAHENLGETTEPVQGVFATNGDVWVTGTIAARLTMTRFPRSPGSAAIHTPLALEAVYDVLPLPDGGVLAVGRSDERTSALECFDATGAVDLGFGTAGIVVDPHRTDERTNSYGAAAVAGEDRILVSGTQFTFGLAFYPVVAAFDRAGRPDRSFGGDGQLVVDAIGGADAIAGAADGGAAILVGTVGFMRLGPSGTLDRDYAAHAADTFVAGFFQLGQAGDLTAVGSAFVPDEPSGSACSNASGVCRHYVPLVGRLLPDGTPDPRFGEGGIVATATDPPSGAEGTGYTTFALAPAARITVACAAVRRPCATSSSRATAIDRSSREPRADLAADRRKGVVLRPWARRFRR